MDMVEVEVVVTQILIQFSHNENSPSL
jgi:hypothetical protein